jgi:NADH-quinone oxidoreductase subunit A
MNEYIPIFIIVLLTSLIGTILLTVSYFGVPKQINIEKTSSYESGFEPFDKSRSQFLVSFYIVGLLFLLFDLEIALLMPFIVIAAHSSILSFIIAAMFFSILTLGLVYELFKNGIEFIGDLTN